MEEVLAIALAEVLNEVGRDGQDHVAPNVRREVLQQRVLLRIQLRDHRNGVGPDFVKELPTQGDVFGGLQQLSR
eukprot:9993172-Alexandrium_andersonii.AAC.1